jgi:hypothetical protein
MQIPVIREKGFLVAGLCVLFLEHGYCNFSIGSYMHHSLSASFRIVIKTKDKVVVAKKGDVANNANIVRYLVVFGQVEYAGLIFMYI